MKCVLMDRRKDGRGYGAVIVCSSFCLIAITDGILFSFGLLMLEIINEFNNNRAISAVIGSILIGVSGLCGPLGGCLCNKYGCRIVTVFGALLSSTGLLVSSFATSTYFLYISYGCCGGIGLGLIYMTANIINVQYFSKHRGKACGIALCGSGVGTFAFNQVYRILLAEYGWRGTVLLQAGMCLQCLVFGVLLPTQTVSLHTKHESEQLEASMSINDVVENEHCNSEDKNVSSTIHAASNDIGINSIKSIRTTINTSRVAGNNKSVCTKDIINVFKQIFDKKLLSDVRFWIFFASTIIVHLAFSVLINMTADYAIESGMSNYDASWLASSIGISNSVGRIVFGMLADLLTANRIAYVSGLLILAGISAALFFLLTSFRTRLIGTTLYGLFIGGYIATCPLLLADTFSSEMIAKSFGMYIFALGLSSLVSTPIGGLLYDKTGRYDVTFIVAGSELIVAGLVVLLLRVINNDKETSD